MWAMAQWHMKEKPEMPGSTGTIKIWLVVSNMIFIFHNIWDVILPMTFIFFKMVKTTNQIRMMSGNHVVLDLYFPSPIGSQLTLTDFWVESAISHLPAVFECLDGLHWFTPLKIVKGNCRITNKHAKIIMMILQRNGEEMDNWILQLGCMPVCVYTGSWPSLDVRALQVPVLNLFDHSWSSCESSQVGIRMAGYIWNLLASRDCL